MNTTTLSPPTPAETSNPNSWIAVATFQQLTDAEETGRLLQQEGIPAEVKDERRLQKAWFWTRPIAGIHVRVREDSLELARDCFDRNPAIRTLIARAIHCPSCQSMRVQYPQMTRRNVLPTLVAQVLIFTGFMRAGFYCQDCHFTWSPQRETRRDRPEGHAV